MAQSEPRTVAGSDLSAHLEKLTAPERIAWAQETYGDQLVMSTSFGIQSAVMLHMATRIVPGIPVIFADTGYLFPETYRFADELSRRLELNLQVYRAHRSPAWQEAVEGSRWEMGANKLQEYNFENKIEPMNRALSELGAKAWMTGLRREQASTRQDLAAVRQQKQTVKIHPIIDWTARDVYEYLTANGLPYHPLWESGYVSVGDWHSSSPLQPGQSEEETRFGGVKRECGLHEDSSRIDFQI